MSVFGLSILWTNLEIMSLLTSNTPGGITTYIECSVMPTPMQPMPNCHPIMFSKDWTCVNMFPVSWATTRSLTSSIHCRLACLTTSRCGCFTSWIRTNSSTSTMHLVLHACLPRPHTKKYVIWGSFSMEWKGDEGNEPGPDWSCNPVPMRRKPRSASHIELCNLVHMAIVRILYVCSI